MTRRRILILLAFGVPGLVLLGVIVFVLLVGPPEIPGAGTEGTATPQTTWQGPTRVGAECPEFYGKGAELFEKQLIKGTIGERGGEYEREVVQVGRQRIAVRKVSFVSYEMQDCKIEEIRVHGVLAMPVGAEKNRSGRLAGVVRMHGLLPHEERRDALELAAKMKVAVLAMYGAGFDQSQGWDSRPDHFFDVATDVRRSWLWTHTMLTLRAVTYLAERPEVDPERIGIVGYSVGGMAALMAAGVDPRVKGVVAWSAAGFTELAARAEPVPGWWVALLEGMNPPRTPASREWGVFTETLDPKSFLESVTAPVLIINGAQDQYFPIDASLKTYDALRAGSDEHRMFLVPGFDHGPMADLVIDEMRPKIISDIVYWFAHHLKLETGYRDRIPIPEVEEVVPTECCPESGCRVCTQVQVGLPIATQYEVSEIELQVSRDNARTFVGRPGKENGRRSYAITLEFMTPDELDDAVYFAEAVYRPLGQVRRIRVSSRPHLPAGFVPRIWPDARLR